jgi:hypothetical protein
VGRRGSFVEAIFAKLSQKVAHETCAKGASTGECPL